MGWPHRLALGLTLIACGPAAQPPPAQRTTPLRAGLPRTDRDPLPYVAPPRPRGQTGQTVTLLAAGGEDQARRMLPALLESLRDGDESGLESLLAPLVFQASRRRSNGAARPRAALVQRMLIYARRGVIPPGTPVADLVELEGIDVQRAVAAYPDGVLPELVESTDLVVEVPVRSAGRTPLRALLGWHERGRMVVRPGSDPRIVAL
ncbi:MAG: hypothetical protein AB8I08_37310 [Sandaracinaceae bacterium]